MIGPFYYRVQLAKGSAFSGVKIWKDFPIDPVTGELLTERSYMWRAELNGEGVPIAEVMIEMDGITDMPVVKGTYVDEVEYIRLSSTVKWAQQHAPDAPEAKPREKIDPLTAPLPW